MAKKLDIITTIKIAVTSISVAVIFIYIGGNIIVEHNHEDNVIEQETEINIGESTNLDMQGITELLKENGVSEDKIKNMQKTASGATLIGDAVPAKEYRTLNDAEKEFGYYLGLHNKLESLDGYELTAMHIINEEFMQGTYESDKESIIVKTSKVKSAEDMAKVYNDMTNKNNQTILGVPVSLKSKEVGKVNVAAFRVPNGKNYVISSVAGLSDEEMKELLSELIDNLQRMDDWQD